MSEVLVDEQLRAAGIVIETGDTQGDYDLTISSPINVVGEAKKALKERRISEQTV